MKFSSNIFRSFFSFVLIVFSLYSCEKEYEVTDSDGNTYKSEKIGKQYWLTENLKTTRYRNGDLIGTTALTSNIVMENVPKFSLHLIQELCTEEYASKRSAVGQPCCRM